MRNRSIYWSVLCSITLLFGIGCAERAQQAILVAAETPAQAETPKLAVLGTTTDTSTAKTKKATLSSAPKKARFAPLGSPKKTDAAAGPGAKLFRASEAKRLLDHYQSNAVRYAEGLALATTPEQLEMLSRREPSAAALRPSAMVMGRLIAEDPTDAPAADLLVFLSKFVDLPNIKTSLSQLTVQTSDGKAAPFDTASLLLEHHSNNAKLVDAMRRMPRGESTNSFLKAVFEKTYNPDVRWSAGAQLISSLRRSGRQDEMMEIVVAMSEDRYLDGVSAGVDTTARGWALDKLREIRTLGVGNVLPDVNGEKLEGGIGQIADYRGRVVVLDVWTTWCGPCRAMMPHTTEMVERLKGKPFAFLNVSCDAKRETLDEFLKDNAMPWDQWWVGSGSKLAKTLNIRAYPQIFVLDRKGVIRYKNIKGEELDEAVDTLLAEIE